MLLAAPPASAGSGWSVTLEDARAVPAVAGTVQLSAVELADGNTLFVYTAPSPAGGALEAVITDAQGALVLGPILIAETGSTSLEFSLTPRGDHGAAVVWVGGSSAAVSLYDGSAFSSLATNAFQSYQVTSCKVASGSDRLVLACDSVPLPPLRPVRQVRLAQIAPDGALLAPPTALSTTPITESLLRALAVDDQGTTWVAFQSPSPVNATGFDFLLEAVDSAGNLPTPPTVLLPDADLADAVKLAPSPLSDGSLWVAFAESGAAGNATVHLQSWKPGERAARFATSFEGGALRALDAAIFRGQSQAGDVGALAWLEADEGNASAPTSGITASLRVILLDANLSALDPVSAPLGAFSAGARFVGSGLAVVDGPSPATLHRITIAPPAAALPAQDITLVMLALAAVSGASALTLAGLSDRFKWALLAPLWPLYAALQRERVLIDNMRRGAILQVVTESPGIRFGDLSRRTGISQGSLKHHLAVLEEFGFVSKSFGRRALTLYPVGKNPIHEEPFKEIREQILREVRAAPGLSHSELARRLGVKWSTLLYHMDILKAEKQVRMRRSRNIRRYFPADRE